MQIIAIAFPVDDELHTLYTLIYQIYHSIEIDEIAILEDCKIYPSTYAAMRGAIGDHQ